MPVHIEGSIYSMKLTSDSVLYELVARPHSLYWNNGSLLHRRQAPRSDIRRMEDGGSERLQLQLQLAYNKILHKLQYSYFL